MSRIKTLELTAEQRHALETGYREDQNHAFRQRCQLILLKSDTNEPRTSLEVAQILGCCEMVVNNWMQRYLTNGIEGLRTKPGRGRKAILNAHTDLTRVQQAVQNNRQRISLAKAELEEALGKRFSDKTLTRFLKNTLLAINESQNVPPKSRVRKFIS